MKLTSVFSRSAGSADETPTTVWEGGGATLPSKFASLAREDATTSDRAEQGQILVMFAVFLIGLMGMLGLATDVGFSVAARRTAQGAADAGAFAGARQIALYKAASPTSAQAEVQTIVSENRFGGHVPTVLSCEYIGNNWSVVGTCNQTVPSNAAGSRVRTRLTVPTFFIRVLPGAPTSVEVGGYAKARVQKAKNLPGDGPFIVCGPSAWDVATGGTMNLVASTSPFMLNSAAIGRTFRIHDPTLGPQGKADCGVPSSSWKGLSNQDANGNKKTAGWFIYDTGDKAGPTRTTVAGANGCEAGTVTFNGCIMILPIATNSPAPDDKQIYVVGFAAFSVTTIDSNTHEGVLLDDYLIPGEGENSWCRDCGGIAVIRLIW
jgi:hypothetical protein